MDAIRLHRQGFPKFLSHQEFARRFHLLAPSVTIEDSLEKLAVEEMVDILDLDPTTYRIGLTKVSSYHFWNIVMVLGFNFSYLSDKNVRNRTN